MFIRVKSTPNSPRKSVQICENIREGNRVRQRVVRNIDIAQNDIHLLELKKLAKAIKDQILEERRGPFLRSKDSEERGAPCGVPAEHTTQSDTLAGHGPEGAPQVLPSDRSSPKLPVDLWQLREKSNAPFLLSISDLNLGFCIRMSTLQPNKER